ncbi:SDR family NAD(P)-dependent oxidoreductase [Nocardia sp. SYP-A9097]|uniref:type I polyketide synthase n=1 Tax=Nocardia sp. SYP-A9097 TaxID=2663237 RepID=UPI00129A47E2|nr:type I polyketide synthase [Nocardia sp. SYP-A9097]MRH88377.1 SDR family NAD(P)-dependent oxidoreductase [Nocardia sp. SYP-A9097]
MKSVHNSPIDSVPVAHEGIAVVGIGCRFPGQVRNMNDFWRLLIEERDAVREVPQDRWSAAAFYDHDAGRPGHMRTHTGGYLDDVSSFDAHFFGITPTEATRIDPQQRLFLETTWEALQDAGIVPEQIAGEKVAVYAGVSGHDYGIIQLNPENRYQIGGHTMTGVTNCIVANRVSYLLDLRGPSMTVDTACSSSLVAIHLAIRSIRSGEATMAIVGGVSTLLLPEATIGFSQGTFLSPEGRCQSFSKTGDGYIRSEGSGTIVLKPVSAAVADGDHIYAVLRGSATNQDGRTTGISVPSEDAQAQMILDACRDAGIAPTQIGYVEAHGTGTAVGDPIEARALGKVLGAGRNGQGPCIVGAVKSNVGHLESAAGMVGIIKACLVVENGEIPANLYAEQPNPTIPFDELGLRLAQTRQPWPTTGPRFAGVNSFGFGGSNAHVVLEGPPAVAPQADSATEHPADEPVLFALSAKTKDALRAYAGEYADFLADPGTAGRLPEIAAAQVRTRSHYDQRLAMVCSSAEELRDTLRDLARGGDPDGLRTGAKTPGPAGVVFVFSGQGPQWWGMARELLAENPVFREVVERVDTELRRHADWSVLEELGRDEADSRIGETFIAQPAVFAVQLGLAALWQSWGVTPAAVVGHSIGEVAAACVSGALSFEDAVRVIFHRSRVQQQASGKGKMLAVGLPYHAAEQRIAGYVGRVEVAALNGPESTALAGDPDALEEIRLELERDRVFCRMLAVSVAFHSHHMDPLHDELLASLSDITSGTAAIPMYSTVTTDVVPDGGLDAGYWWRNIREPVRFAPTIDRLVEDLHLTFVELGPHPIHATAIGELLAARAVRGVAVPSLHRKQSDRATLLSSLGELYVAGVDPVWETVFAGRSERVPVPFYPWQRETYWLETPLSRGKRFPSLGHPLVGTRTPVADEPDKHVWELVMDTSVFPWLEDHRVQGPIVFPGAGHLDLVVGCLTEVFGTDRYSIENVEFRRPLFVFDDRPAPLIQVVLSSSMHFGVYSLQDGDKDWVLHSSGTARRGAPDTELPVPFEELDAHCPLEFDPAKVFAKFRNNGLMLGPTFKAITQLKYGELRSLGRIDTPAAIADEASRHLIHPALLDACFQSLSIAMGNDPNTEDKALYIPFDIGRFSFYAKAGERVYCYGQAHVLDDPVYCEGDLWLLNEDGSLVAHFEGFKGKSITQPTEDRDTLLQWLYEYQWRPAPVRVKTLLPADFLPEAAALAAAVEPIIDEVRDWSLNREYYASTEAEMNRLCIAYVTETFFRLGMNFAEGRQFDLDTIIGELGVSEKYRDYTGRLLELLTRHGITSKDGDLWSVRIVPDRVDPAAALARLREQHPECEAEYAVLERCGAEQAAVLRDEVNPIELIFPETEFQSVVDLYETSFSFERCNRTVAEVVSQAVRTLPSDRPIRVLELGAGTAGTTGWILKELPADRAEYAFTDIGQLFLNKARGRFAEFDFVDYRILDIEQDVAAQGFDPHYFDIVVAANVLHATENLRVTLGNVEQLLTSGGLMLVVEETNPPHWVDLTFGMTDGWWRFADHDLRPDYPLLSEEKWREFLPTLGFEHVQIFSDMTDPEQTGCSVIAARAPRVDLEPHQPRIEPGPWVVLADADGVAEHYVALLGEAAAGSVIVTRGESFEQISERRFEVNPTSNADLRRVLEQVRAGAGTVAGVLHLWNLDFAAAELTTELLPQVERHGAYSVMALAQAVEELDWAVAPRFWVATAGGPVVDPADLTAPSQIPAWGILRVLLSEHSNLRAKIIDFDPAAGADARAAQLFGELLHVRTAEEEIAYRGDTRFVDRFEHISLAEFEASVAAPTRISDETPFALTVPADPGIDELRYEKQTAAVLGPNDVAIRPTATGLNFRDIMLTLGVLSEGATSGGFYEKNLGVECAGVVTELGSEVTGLAVGDAVIAFARGCFGSRVVTDAQQVYPAPGTLSAAEAATLPMAYLTAWYSLVEVGRLRAGERVLVHAAAGGVGLAAVHIAQRFGATVLATAGSPEKRDYLRSLGVEEVFDSRSLAFADEIRQRYDGVDIVLNSLQGETIPKSLELLRPHGRFIEIGKKDIYDNYQLGLKPFGNNLSYSAVDIDRMLREVPARCREAMTQVLDQVSAGTLPALPHTDFGAAEVASAFRYMAGAKQIGKVVVEFDSGAEVLVYPAENGAETFDPDGTYLITGGYTGFGLRTAQWLAGKGARTIVLVGRRAQIDAENEQPIAALRAEGVEVVLERADVSIEAEVRDLLERISALPPLRGIYHAAMVIADGPLATMSEEQFLRTVRPKVDGAWHLHNLTRELELDAFVMFSSMSWNVGTPGQSNYAAANGFLDALAVHRHQLGLPALTVNWGAIGEVGFVARTKLDTLSWLGWTPIAPDLALDFIGRCLVQGVSRASVFGVNWTKMNQVMPIVRSSPRLAHLAVQDTTGAATAFGTEGLRAELSELPDDERLPRLVTALAQQISRIFDMPADRLAQDVGLTDLGMDSLMAGQIRNMLAKHLEIDFPTMGLMRGPSIVELAGEVLAHVSGEITGATPASAGEATGPERWIRTVIGRSNTASMRLFALPFVGGGASVFTPWPGYLPDSVEVVGIQFPGREERLGDIPVDSMPEFVAELAEAMLPHLDRTFVVYGHSMGGLLAYELTKYLEQHYNEVPMKLVIGGWPAPTAVENYVRNLTHIRDGFDLDSESDSRVLAVLRDNRLLDIPVADETSILHWMPSIRADLKMLGDYRFENGYTLRAPISVLRGADDPVFDLDQLQGWGKLTSGGFSLATVPGGHLFIQNPEPQVMKTIVQELSAEDAFPSFTSLVDGH